MATTQLPAGTLGVDYSFARPSPSALYDAGVRFVSRYLAVKSSKVIDADERDALWAAGLTILLNWEQSAGDFMVPSKGASQGSEAASQAAALGYPTDLPILVSCDSDANTAGKQQAALEYFQNFTSGAGGHTLGVYGQSQVANLLVENGLVTMVWAPNATSWNAGVAYTQLDIQQHFGVSKYPTLQQFGDQIDVDTTERTITVWSGPGGSSTGGSGTGSSTSGSGSGGSSASGSDPGGTSYTVQPGDSWWGIAASQMGSGTRDTELAAYNGKTTSDVIHPGDVLKIPS